MPKYEFTMVTDAMLAGLSEAGATGAETMAYILLVRGLPLDRRRTDCWMPADMAEKKGVMSAHTFSKMLRSLTKKTVTLADGTKAPILTQLTRGCRGHSPHFEDTLGKSVAAGLYPPELGHQLVTQNKGEMGTQN